VTRRLSISLGSAVLAGAVSLALAIVPAGAQSPETIVLGAAAPANASCPDDCLVEARVTGFQTSIGKIKNPFVAPVEGNVVAWSIKLGKPNKPDRRSFNEEFGASVARLSVLRQVQGRNNPPRYKLLRQSPAEQLAPFFGSTTTFTLTAPLPAKRGDVVALTIPSWAPAFAVDQGNATKWMASRRATKKRGDCADEEGRANVDAGAPQVKKGSQRPYGCTYDSARLLYSATFLAD
jgi:hypothetical protein